MEVGRAGFNNHSPSVSGFASVQGEGPWRNVNVAWIESAAGDTSGIGRIMWQRLAGRAEAANDNAIWVGSDGGIGALGCEPLVTGLAAGESLVTWVGADGNAHGRLYGPNDGAPDNGQAARYASMNEALADFGPVAPETDGNRRLQVVETRPGSLAVMWLALDQGFVLRGSIFTPRESPSGEDDGWSEIPIADIRPPPGFTGQFSLQGAGGHDVVVTYSKSGSDGGTVALSRRIEGPGSEGQPGHAGPEFPAGSEADGALVYAAGDGEGADHASTPLAEAQAAGAASTGEQLLPISLQISDPFATDPVVKGTQSGYAVTWQAPGASEGSIAIRMAMFDANGNALILADGSTVITITENALATVVPSITDVGSGAAVAYVEAGGGGLIIKAYDGDGSQVGSDVVVDEGSSGAVSEVAMDSHAGDGEQPDELAVVYVRDDHDDDPEYGNVVLQRYQMPGDENGDLVPLGGDGQHDGADDPVVLSNGDDGNPDTCDDVIGRAPAVADLDHGELAVVWVEKDGARETIKGRVLESDGGQVLQIDLTGLLQDGGIAKGTKPTLVANAGGDILVSWLQPEGKDGYALMAAVYEAVGPGQWTVPEEPMRLRGFDEEPDDFSIAWSDANGAAIDVTWRDDSSGSGSGKGILSQRYDLDGNNVGYTKKLGRIDNDADGEDALSVAGLGDGQIVVVYAEQGNRGDLDLAAHVVDTKAAGASTVEVSKDDVLTGNAGIAVVQESSFSTDIDQEIAIDLPAMTSGASVSHVNGAPITAGTPVDVGYGWVQLREDGQLTVSPDSGYAGTISFDYTLANGDQPGTTGTVAVDVSPDASLRAMAVSNRLTTMPDDAPTADDIKVADISVYDGELSTAGLSLAGLDANLFKIVENTLYIRAGIDFDFDTKPTLSVEIRADSQAAQDQSINFSLDVESSASGQLFISDPDADTFVFAPGFGETSAADHDVQEVIDVSSSGYSTFQELIDSGALVQAGEDVVIMFDPANPDQSDKITLRGIDLSVLTSADFKF